MQSDQLFGIRNVLVGEDLDEIDQGKNAADTEAESHDDLEDTLLGLTHHEVMDAKAAKEEADQSNGDLILAVETFAVDSVLDGNTALQADVRAGAQGIAAVCAECVTGSGLDTALQADGLVGVHFSTAISTKHEFSLFSLFYV